MLYREFHWGAQWGQNCHWGPWPPLPPWNRPGSRQVNQHLLGASRQRKQRRNCHEAETFQVQALWLPGRTSGQPRGAIKRRFTARFCSVRLSHSSRTVKLSEWFLYSPRYHNAVMSPDISCIHLYPFLSSSTCILYRRQNCRQFVARQWDTSRP